MLEEDRYEMLYHLVAQLLFTISLSRRDIYMAVSLLNKKVNIPDEDYWEEMKLVLKYLKITKHVKLTFIVNSLVDKCILQYT